MTIYDIARQCGVSATTVSRVISNSAPVSSAVRDKVLAAMENANYVPQPRRRKNQTQKIQAQGSGLIGVFLPEFGHSYFDRVVRELHEQLICREKSLVLLPVDERSKDLWMRQLHSLPLEGVVLLQENTPESLIGLLQERKIPLVMCGALSLNKSFSSVHVDDIAASYDGIKFLLRLGHRKIGLISDSPRDISSGFQRLTGSGKALSDGGVSCPDDWKVCNGCTYQNGYEAARHLLSLHPEITALFAFSDVAAFGAMAAARDMGRRLPEELSVLGFDDIITEYDGLPKLTCVHQPMEQIVSKSLELLDQAASGDGEPVSSVILPHTIIERDSCRHPAL